MYCLLPARTPLFIATRRFAVRRHVPIESRAPLPQHTATTCVHVSGCRACCNQRCRGRCNRAVSCCKRVVSCCKRVASCCAAVVPGASSHCFEPNAHVRAARPRTTCNIATLRHALHAALRRHPRGKIHRWARGPHTRASPSGLQCAALRCVSWAEQRAPCCATTARRRRRRRRRA
jgi:hypothetical protein